MRTIHDLPNNKNFRKKLRNENTYCERILWSRLKSKQTGYKFRRQHGIGRYIVDFYCPAKRLIIEIDGSQHAWQKNYDNARTRYFESMNYRVLRFWNNEVLESLDGVMEIIMSELTAPPPVSPSTEGESDQLTE